MKKEFLVTIKAIISVNDEAELQKLIIAKIEDDKITGDDDTFSVIDYTEDWLSYEETDKNVLDGLYQGQLVILDNIPYIIAEVDYDDISVKLYNGQMDDNGFWVDIDDIKKIQNNLKKVL